MDHAAYKLSSEPVTRLTQVQFEWQDLQKRSECSYFQSWSWISCWLQKIAIKQQVTLVRVHQEGVLVGLGFFIPAQLTRHKIIHADVMFLNEYPIADNDMVMEYNGLLVQTGCEQPVYQQVLQYLHQQFPSIDEFHFGALSQQPAYSALAQCKTDGFNHVVHATSTSWQVDLTKFEPDLDAYLARLSKNSRAQIRYSKKHYEKHSPVLLQVAANVEQALIFFDALKKLHIKHWQTKGQRHAFADDKWEDFHRYIIEQNFSSGEIQLIRIANEQQDIAYLFNYVWRNRVYVLQMGFNYLDNSRIKPGYLAHAMAVVYNRDNAMQLYDFMHGFSRYKSSLSDLTEELVWSVLQRPRLKLRFENLATGIVRALRKK